MGNQVAMSWEMRSNIRRGKPLTWKGLKFYPIRMEHYEEFLDVRNALAIRMTSLSNISFEYLSMPFLTAMWAIDYDTLVATGSSIGFFERIIRFLYLSLRLKYKKEEALRTIYTDPTDRRILDRVVVTQDGNTVEITPDDFDIDIRPLLAAQNGIDLPDESENPDLVRAEEDLAAKGASELKVDTDTMIASVAYQSHLKEKDLDKWTVLEFERRRQAIERGKRFDMFGQAELSGMVKFGKGNPFPSWCFDRNENGSAALISFGEMRGKLAGLGDLNKIVNGEKSN